MVMQGAELLKDGNLVPRNIYRLVVSKLYQRVMARPSETA